ncbi:MAG: ribonuclease HII [Chloroflexota bacterium]|nr:ribonuclease HII [Chloroflexota bacterium]
MRTSARPPGRLGAAIPHPARASARIDTYATWFVPGGRAVVPSGMELRLDPDWREERALWSRGYRFVAGLDEVGRGSLAGPVVAGAVILPPGWAPEGLRDSKLLDAPTRERLAGEIRGRALAHAVGAVDPTVIDRINILQATLLAAMVAASRLAVRPDALLLDSLCLPDIGTHQRTLVDADRLSVSVAAASVLAKVYRDALMTEQDKRFPGYGFASHKGYACPEHWAAIDSLGPSPLHRLSFAGCAPNAEAETIPIWSEEDG